MTATTLERQVARRRLAQRLDQLLPLELSTETPVLTVRPGPIGKPNGPGLWHVKGMDFPPYFENVRNALIRNGHSTKDASKITWGAIRRWARGGGHVHSEVRSAARAALASISDKEARAHAQSSAKEHVLSVTDQLVLREFANPYHGAAGGGKGGQFVTSSGTGGGAAPAAKAGTAAKKPSPNQPPRISPAQQDAYLKQAAAYATKAKALRQQAAQINHMIAALSALIAQEQKALAIASSGKTASGTGTKTGAGKGTTTTAAAKGTKTAASAKASATASATAKKTAASNSASTSNLHTMLNNNKAQMKQLVAKRDALINSANKMDQQAARFTRLASG